ncbi:MAG: chemotaxis protein CheW [Acidobacteriota bacterium]
MVDLVKIRKKAKKAGIEQLAASSQQPAVAEQPSNPATQQPPPRDPEKLERFKETAGKKKEGFIKEAVQTTAAAEVEVLTFALAGEHYAVNIDHIIEIVTPRAATRVPNADRSVVGIISLRGLIVTQVDVRAKLHHPRAADGTDPRIIVVERNGETLGFEVDRVLRVVKLDAAAVEPHPVVHSSELTDAIRGVFRHAGALTILLDLDKLLA